MIKASPKAIDGWIHRYLAGYSTVELGVPVMFVDAMMDQMLTVRFFSLAAEIFYDISLKRYRLHRTTGEWVECAAAYDPEYGLLLSSIKTLQVEQETSLLT